MVVKFSKEFVGKNALAQIEAAGVTRKLVGLEVEGTHTIRNGYPIYSQGKQVGRVTSGPLSESLIGRNCGLGFVAIEAAKPGTEIEVDIRGKRTPGRVVDIPFRARRVKDEPGNSTWPPYQLRFSESHVWAGRINGSADVFAIGFTDFAQRSLGDILSVELPKTGEQLSAGTACAWVDSYRRPFDIIAPLSGEVVEVNEAVVQRPARINAYPYAREGLLKVKIQMPRAYEELLPFEAYAELIRRLSRYDEWTRERRTT